MTEFNKVPQRCSVVVVWYVGSELVQGKVVEVIRLQKAYTHFLGFL